MLERPPKVWRQRCGRDGWLYGTLGRLEVIEMPFRVTVQHSIIRWDVSTECEQGLEILLVLATSQVGVADIYRER